MSGNDRKTHHCEKEYPPRFIWWSDHFKAWYLNATSVQGDDGRAIYNIDIAITHCPYCGEKLKEPEEE